MRTIFEEARELSIKRSPLSDAQKLRAKISSLESQVEATTERISILPKGIDAQVFFNQILKMQKAKGDLELKLSAVQSDQASSDSPLSIDEFERFTIDLKNLAQRTTDPDVQASICRKVIKKIEVSVKGITIQYHVGESHYGVEFDQESSVGGSVEKSAGPRFISRPLKKYGSNSLTIGRGSRTRTWDPTVMSRLL